MLCQDFCNSASPHRQKASTAQSWSKLLRTVRGLVAATGAAGAAGAAGTAALLLSGEAGLSLPAHLSRTSPSLSPSPTGPSAMLRWEPLARLGPAVRHANAVPCAEAVCKQTAYHIWSGPTHYTTIANRQHSMAAPPCEAARPPCADLQPAIAEGKKNTPYL